MVVITRSAPLTASVGELAARVTRSPASEHLLRAAQVAVVGGDVGQSGMHLEGHFQVPMTLQAAPHDGGCFGSPGTCRIVTPTPAYASR